MGFPAQGLVEMNRSFAVALGATLVLAVSACGSNDAVGPSAAGQDAASGSTKGTFSGSVAPAVLTLPTGSRAFVRTVDQRTVLYVIPDPAPTRPGPLMIVLDYLGGNPTFMANLILAGQHASQGAVLAFPEHLGASWINGVPFSGEGDQQTDIDFLSDVIDDAVNNMPVDARRISMTGYSEGGFEADLFACTKPQMLSGFGMVAATQLTTTSCPGAAPLKRLIFAGTNDGEVPYNGLAALQPVETTMGQWEKAESCGGTEDAATLPTVVSDGTSVIQHQVPGCGAILYEIVNGGHTWPGAEITLTTTLLDGTTTQNIDATQAQWDYFFGN